MHFNYFTIQEVIDLGNGIVLLVLSHEYGNAEPVKLPVTGSVRDFVIGQRVEVSANVV